MDHAGRMQGFTLIELSIVLVIIGLIVGGVLVGQDLIRAAEVRATISQIEKYNTAANTFLGKYGYLPGDIKDPDASNFGFISRHMQCQDGGLGDGNGVIEGDYEDRCGGNNSGGYKFPARRPYSGWI
jgi:prepilin-type N-terminal cleavage/methylation domain-containing protein